MPYTIIIQLFKPFFLWAFLVVGSDKRRQMLEEKIKCSFSQWTAEIFWVLNVNVNSGSFPPAWKTTKTFLTFLLNIKSCLGYIKNVTPERWIIIAMLCLCMLGDIIYYTVHIQIWICLFFLWILTFVFTAWIMSNIKQQHNFIVKVRFINCTEIIIIKHVPRESDKRSNQKTVSGMEMRCLQVRIK